MSDSVLKKKETIAISNLRVSYRDINDEMHETAVQLAVKSLKLYESGRSIINLTKKFNGSMTKYSNCLSCLIVVHYR